MSLCLPRSFIRPFMPPIEVDCGHPAIPNGHDPRDLLVVHGPTLSVDVGFDPNYVAGQGKFPSLAMTGVDALVDTGAGESFIDDALALQLNLTIVDQKTVSGSNGSHTVNMYLAHVHVPALHFTLHGLFGGVGLSAGGQRHRALIGRTFLQHFQMTYDGRTGRVLLSRS